MSEFVSLRVRRSAMGKLYRLKARLMLEREQKVSDAEVVEEAFAALENEKTLSKGRGKNLLAYAGIIKGGPRTNSAKEIDKVLYG